MPQADKKTLKFVQFPMEVDTSDTHAAMVAINEALTSGCLCFLVFGKFQWSATYEASNGVTLRLPDAVVARVEESDGTD